MLPDYKNAIVIQNNNAFVNRNGLKPRYVIIHGTAGGESAQAIANYFASTQGGENPVSSHYVIGRDGAIVQCVSESDGAWANGAFSAGHDSWWNTAINPNLTTISIELCKPSTDNSDQLTAAQQASCFLLTRDICQRHGIPMRAADANGGITGHFSLDPINRRNCPGPFPWSDLWTFLIQGAKKNMDTVPSGWKDDGKTLISPNGHKVVDGFRAYVLANGWDAANEPIENECHVSQLETHNPGLGAGQRQLFTFDMLYWTPATNVKRSSLGLEIQAYASVVGALQAHIAQQQLQLQKAYDTAPLPAPASSPVNVDELAAVLIDLRDSKSDAINAVSVALKAACQKALADIGK